MCIQELFAGVGVLQITQQDLTSPDPDQIPPDQDKEANDGQEEDGDSPVAHLSAEISRLKDEALVGREKIEDLQEQVQCNV